MSLINKVNASTAASAVCVKIALKRLEMTFRKV